jgi:hypothetical protein
MSDEFEQLLRTGMDRFAAQACVPPGLATRAFRHRQRRKLATRAAVAATTAAAVGATGVVLAGATGAPRAVTQARNAAYVLGRTEAALAETSSQNVIQHVRETASGKRVYEISSLTPGTYAEWAYRGQARFVHYTADGRLSGDSGSQIAGTQYTDTTVSYHDRTWWRQTTTVSSNYAPPNCAVATGVSGPALATDWAAGLRAALRCGTFTIAGTEEVDGVRALKLTQVLVGAVYPVVFWVDPATYLPVRDLVTNGPDASMQVDFQWLRPTQANLANLHVVIPAGFTQVQVPVPGAGPSPNP